MARPLPPPSSDTDWSGIAATLRPTTEGYDSGSHSTIPVEAATFAEPLPGPDGLSAYEIALDNGFVGTEDEWLASLVGPQGPSGGLYYVHTQGVAAMTWTVVHNLGQQPGGVLVVDHNGEQIWGDISFVGLNTIIFESADLVSGVMYLS